MIDQEQQRPLPRIIYEGSTDEQVEANVEVVADTMLELGITENIIKQTTLLVLPESRTTNGSAWPEKLGRLRHRKHQELHDSQGPVVRLNLKVHGKERTAEEINRTLVHELEHVSQIGRADTKLMLGHAAIWGLAAAGVAAGNKLGRGKSQKTAFSLLGAGIGHQAGYRIAPHERQARIRSDEVKTSAISLK
ncbi:MAG TPA: hypothetical protein VF996_01170 [Candidatus Saccharimonadales bacterium]